MPKCGYINQKETREKNGILKPINYLFMANLNFNLKS